MDKELLKFITCGSVDDGKSTLIGHMLYDAKLIFADQKRALEMDSKVGSADGGIDYSLLLDGLMAEREQGITIDVAYRYFSTKKRSFIVADTPGHEEYTRNMAVGASFAELAIILVDVCHGVLIQTRRHTRICDLMGIKHFVFAVNKMDLVDYSREQFDRIEKDIRDMMSEFAYESISIIPVSATAGDNVTKKSENMSWYSGPALLEYLEAVDVTKAVREEGFLLPVQRVCRPNHTFRGFQGEVAAGTVSVGDEITAYPSEEHARVRSIYVGTESVRSAEVGQPVNISIDREIDISRGCVLTGPDGIRLSSRFEAELLWMDEEKLQAGKTYLLKLGTQNISATVINIAYKIDLNTGKHRAADKIYKNEIARCEIATGMRIPVDTFDKNTSLGSLILVDRISHATVACGVVKKYVTDDNNVVWQQLDITSELRQTHMGQRACTIWMTGLSGSGKSTIANALEKQLFSMGRHTMLLDGDNVRMGLCGDLGFTDEDRAENIRRVAHVAKLMNDAGLIVITAFISPTAAERENARRIIGENFVEVYVSTPLSECEKRDVKGLYKKARKGEIKNFTGISSAYEQPDCPELTMDTSELELGECVDIIMEYLDEK